MSSESVSPEQQVLLREEVWERFEQDDELLQEVFSHFAAEAPERLRRIRSFFQAGDVPALRKEIHSLKGVAANLSAKRLAATCLGLEPVLLAGGLPPSLDALEHELAELLRRLEAELSAWTATKS